MHLIRGVTSSIALRSVGFLVGAGLAIAALSTTTGCSSSDEAASPPTALDQVKAKLEGQAIVIIPFDQGNPACEADPEGMPQDTLAACAYLAPAQASYERTSDPRAFDPAPERKMMLVVRGPSLDPNRDGWLAVIGLGALPKEGGPLVTTQTSAAGLHPQFVPLVIGGAYLLDAAFAAAIVYFGARAVVQTNQMLNDRQSRPIVEGTQRVIERTTTLINCTPDEHGLLGRAKGQACDNLPNSCSELVRNSGGGGAVCVGLQGRRGEYEKCRQARQDVVDKCFGGTPSDKEHADQIKTMESQVASCDSHLANICPN